MVDSASLTGVSPIIGFKARLRDGVSRRSRASKIDWLRGQIEPESSVLVVGATVLGPSAYGTANMIEEALCEFTDVIALIYEEGDTGLPVPTCRGDACALPFADKSFDYVFSNAVIEHVGGVKRARLMLAESVRVARKGAFHTTPDRKFPIEVHTQLPLLHWLPRGWQAWTFAKAGRSYWTPDYYWLFTRRSLRALDSRFDVTRNSPMTLIATWRDCGNLPSGLPNDAVGSPHRPSRT